MQYVRAFDPDKAVDAGFPGFRAQVLSHLESALLMSSHIKEGGCGPGLHYHSTRAMRSRFTQVDSCAEWQERRITTGRCLGPPNPRSSR